VTLVVLLGGARSGKSQLAVSLAMERAAPVTFVATAQARDDEMRARIAAHRAERPPEWVTVEAPLELDEALGELAREATAIVDCLSLWVANLQETGADEAKIVAAGSRAADRAGARPGLTIAVSNEVGLGIVPMNPLARAYRDLLGTVNRTWVGTADEAWLVVAGRRLRLE
jgi:adenosylcobinamide kinase / adenosylcobinamide-phosphate guanylyltransferase